MPVKIYVLIGELESGPFTKSEIFAMMKEGSIGPDALGRRENESEWRSINTVLASGGLGLFTPEQIAKQQEELPEKAIIISDFIPARKEVENSSVRPKSRRVVSLATVAVILMLCSGAFLFYVNRERPSDNTATTSPPESRPEKITQTQSAASSPELIRQAAVQVTPTAIDARISPSTPVVENSVPANESVEETQAIAVEAATPVPVVSVARHIDPETDKLPPNVASFQPMTKEILLSTTKEITDARMWISQQVESPRGVLVLCLDDKPEIVVKDQAWLTFARDQELTLVSVAFSSPKELLVKKKGYLHAEKDSGPLLIAGLNEANIANLPLFVYGRGNGGTFVSSFANFATKQVVSWSAFTDTIFAIPKTGDTRPALLGIDYEISKLNPSALKVFEVARDIDLKWTWLSVVGNPNERIPQFQEFVRSYFSRILANGPRNGVWVGTDTLEKLAFTDLMSAPRNAAWLPEESLVDSWKKMMPTPEQRKDPVVIRKTVDTKVKSQPQIEMFLRLPPQYSKDHPLKGTLAFCTWERDANVISKELLYRIDMKQVAEGPAGIVARLIRYAEKHDMAVLTWTTSQVWSLTGSNEELDRKNEKDFDRNFDRLSNAWENGVKFFARNHNMPDNDMLLFGISRGAQWAHRLALRKPNSFLAVHVHIPSTFDSPTPQANQVLWLVTTGEREKGYERAIRFYNECRKLNYPIIFKAIMGLGHSDSPLAENLGFRFFDYALAMREKRNAVAATKTNPLEREDAMRLGAWQPNFKSPPYVGDLLNQDIFPFNEAGMVPVALQVPLPNESVAEAWRKN